MTIISAFDSNRHVESIQHLSDAALLAILLAPSQPTNPSKKMAQKLLVTQGSLYACLHGEFPTLQQSVEKFSHAQYQRLQAVHEVQRRMLVEHMKAKPILNDATTVKNYCIVAFAQKKIECCLGLFLNAQHHLLADHLLAQGTVDQAAIYPREVLKKALAEHATSIIIAHNHPSGSLHPSQSDIQFTLSLKKALELVDVQLLDHIIVGDNKAYSFAENSLL